MLLDLEDNFSLVYIIISLGLILTFTKSLILNPIFGLVSYVCFLLKLYIIFLAFLDYECKKPNTLPASLL
jgi:hypothetical protein